MAFKLTLKKTHVLIALLCFLGLVVFYFLFDWTMGAIIHSRKSVLVPDLKGKTLTEAVTQLSALNFAIKQEGEEFDQNVPAGTILRQNPLAGMAVRERKTIRVTVSQGGQMITVPPVVGQPMRSAEIALRSAGLSLGEETMRYSVVTPKDYVLAQDPAGASVVDKDDAMVNLVVSQGSPPNDVHLFPSFSGKSITDAAQWTQQNGLKLTVLDEPGHAGVPGVIYRQEPPPDTDCSGLKDVTVYAGGGTAAAPGAGTEKVFYYEIPQGGDNRSVRLVMRDESGETEIFKGMKPPGSKLSIPISPQGKSSVRVYMDSILVEEQPIK